MYTKIPETICGIELLIVRARNGFFTKNHIHNCIIHNAQTETCRFCFVALVLVLASAWLDLT